MLLFAALLLLWILPGAQSVTASFAIPIGVYTLIGLTSFMGVCYNLAPLRIYVHQLLTMLMSVACQVTTPRARSLESSRTT